METPLRHYVNAKSVDIDIDLRRSQYIDQFIKDSIPRFPALPTIKAVAGRRQRDEWIWDSGSTNDLIGIQDVKPKDLDNKTLLHSPVILDTAGGKRLLILLCQCIAHHFMRTFVRC